MALKLTSLALAEGKRIPDEYARDGENLSPPLQWSDAPEGTKSFALVVEDPDAPSGMFRHWAVYDIPAGEERLVEGAGETGELNQGVNDFGNARYDGPQPPRGHGTHHYHFRLAALDTDRLDIGGRQSAEEIWEAVQPHIVEEAELVGTYER